MSAFVSAIPGPMSHMERRQDFFSLTQYPSNADYGEMASLPIRSYNEIPNHQGQGISPISSASSPSTGQLTSLSRSSRATSRSPPTRQTTPSRHNRSSSSRAQSSGRPEALLAYNAQQESQMTSSQSVASSQGAFPPSAYMMAPVNSYHEQNGYYSSSGMSQRQQGGPYMMAQSSCNVEPNPSTSYFSVGRSPSYPLETLPSMQAPDLLYQNQLASNGPSHVWPPSTSAPPLPSMSVPSSNSFSPSPASSMDNPEGIRILASRPKPQCFDHGCNGRQFSTFSNLLRHQREKSGNASKAVCPHCGTEFTRTTARNGHLYAGKCKGRDGQGGLEPEA